MASHLRETFLLDYGTVLIEHTSLWQVGLSYLDHCPTEGIYRIEILLSHLPLETEARSFKIIREAESRNLTSVGKNYCFMILSQIAQPVLTHIIPVSSICKIRGMISLRSERLGNALTWALRSRDGSFTSYLADKFLQEYSTNGKLKDVDLLHNLGPSMLVSDKLIFLGRYNLFSLVNV